MEEIQCWKYGLGVDETGPYIWEKLIMRNKQWVFHHILVKEWKPHILCWWPYHTTPDSWCFWKNLYNTISFIHDPLALELNAWWELQKISTKRGLHKNSHNWPSAIANVRLIEPQCATGIPDVRLGTEVLISHHIFNISSLFV